MTQPSHTHTCTCAWRAVQEPTVEEQTAAWEAYCQARKDADRTLRLADGVYAVERWKDFANLFLAEDRKLQARQPRSNTVIFPVHRSSYPGA